MSGEELRALAEAATPNERRWPSAEFWCDHGAGYMRDAAFIAAANPTAVLALLDERDALRADRDHWKAHAEEAGYGFAQVCRDYARTAARNVELGRERDDLYAQVERVRALADEWHAAAITAGRRGREAALAASDDLRAALDGPA